MHMWCQRGISNVTSLINDLITTSAGEQGWSFKHCCSSDCPWQFSITAYVYVLIFRSIFGVTFYINISVTDTPVQAENIKKQAKVSHLCAHSIVCLDIKTGLPPLIYMPTSTGALIIDCIFSIGALGTNFCDISIKIQLFAMWNGSTMVEVMTSCLFSSKPTITC